MVATAKYVPGYPLSEPLAVAGDPIPSQVKSVVSCVVAMRIRGVSTRRNLGNRRDNPVRQNDCIHRRCQGLDDFFNRDDQRTCRQRRLFLGTNNATDENVTLAIGGLGVQDGDIWIDRWHRRNRRVCVRATYFANLSVDAWKIRSDIAAQHSEWQPGCA